ncbi:MAG: undecaprenyldiphospho-muramoylpentapeptide beta-N-acetylglucosaminyltransferase [Bacteroidetes bacterium]|nr:undecaprenyldiphospho-muramoylpentapeptide beta-N-acetylglucosaminyltransferase [Bacteroidota bacterium]
MSNKIIIAGGGTGGHIFPAIAIANALKAQSNNVELLFVGARGKMEMEKVPMHGFHIKGIDIAGFQRGSFFKNISLPYKLLKSFFQVRSIINKFKPDAVIGVGGYSSYPVLRLAQQKNIPSFIHESNSFAGKSNILLGKRAVKIFVASEGMEKFFPAEKIILTGNPVRKTISASAMTRSEAIPYFKLNPNKKIILVVGGSLGAQSINEVIAKHVIELDSLGLQLIWQTGNTNASFYASRAHLSNGTWVGSFIEEMDKAYACADVVVSRAGAMSVAELCVCKKPVIFVPYPYAAENHQYENAKYLVHKNAALLVKNEDAKSQLFKEITMLAKDETLQATLSENIGKLAVYNADERIAEEILQYLAQKENKVNT